MSADLPGDTGVAGGASLRTCVGCRRRAPREDLLRVTVVAGTLTPDPRRVLPGRGASLHPDLRCLELAERRKAFPRALRVPGPLAGGPVRAHLAAEVAPSH